MSKFTLQNELNDDLHLHITKASNLEEYCDAFRAFLIAIGYERLSIDKIFKEYADDNL